MTAIKQSKIITKQGWKKKNIPTQATDRPQTFPVSLLMSQVKSDAPVTKSHKDYHIAENSLWGKNFSFFPPPLLSVSSSTVNTRAPTLYIYIYIAPSAREVISLTRTPFPANHILVLHLYAFISFPARCGYMEKSSVG